LFTDKNNSTEKNTAIATVDSNYIHRISVTKPWLTTKPAKSALNSEYTYKVFSIISFTSWLMPI